MNHIVDRVLLIANRRSGTGATETHIDALNRLLREHLPAAELTSRTVDEHHQVGSVAGEFLDAAATPGAILVCGGGGTLRAVIETLFAANEHTRNAMRIGPLRMGSGNVLARQLSVPRDPKEAIADFTSALKTGRSVPGCVMACSVSGDGTPRTARTHYAVTLGGFGQFGQIPADLALSHRRWPRLHRLWARVLGIERLTNIEYACALLRRSMAGALFPSRFEQIEIKQGHRVEQFRLLSGALLNFPLRALPFKTNLRLEEPELELHAVPFCGRWHALSLVFTPREAVRRERVFRIAPDMPLEMRLLDRSVTGFFLDEDPEAWSGTLQLRLAGRVAFLPGREYKAKT